MRISLLEIENFRGIRSGRVVFGDHAVLIGPNNSGKTTVVEALALVLGRDRLVRSLTEHDFFGSDPGANDRLKIVATVIGFGTEDPADHPDWFRDGRGVPFWFDHAMEDIVPERVNDTQTLACQIIFSARFDRDSLEVETARHFADSDDIDVFGEESFVTVPPKLIRELGLFIMPASRTWDRMLSFSSELFRRVVRSADGMPSDTVLEERDRLRAPENKLDEDPRFKPIVDAVNNEMSRLMGDGVSTLRLRLTSTDSVSVLETIAPHFSNATELPVPSKRQGNGLISLQSLFLLLHFAQKRIEEGGSFIMALEEPELHLPPSVQRRILARLQALSTQTIVTTHSPLISAYCEPTSLLIVRNDAGSLVANPLLRAPLAADASNGIRKLFQINRIETAAAMMSDRVLVPEGRFDSNGSICFCEWSNWATAERSIARSEAKSASSRRTIPASRLHALRCVRPILTSSRWSTETLPDRAIRRLSLRPRPVTQSCVGPTTGQSRMQSPGQRRRTKPQCWPL